MQAPHIDKTDFLNAVVREKKRFENNLDDSVAAGMNAGTDVLMNQVSPSALSSRIFKLNNNKILGRTHHSDADEGTRVLSSRGCAS